jgi:hypothetical protein
MECLHPRTLQFLVAAITDQSQLILIDCFCLSPGRESVKDTRFTEKRIPKGQQNC